MTTILFIIILIYSVIFHELAHGYMAEKLGDPTPRLAGRLTLNPIPHLDLFGSIILPAFLIFTHSPVLVGWAKPVPFNPAYLKNKKWGPALVAIAGPLANILLALIFSILLKILPVSPTVQRLFIQIIITNIALAVFNLVPIPPLDGHHVLFALLGKHASSFKRFFRQYSLIILIIFIFYGWKFISPIVISIAKILIGSL